MTTVETGADERTSTDATSAGRRADEPGRPSPRGTRTAVAAAVLVGALVMVLTIAAMAGSTAIAPGDVWRIIGAHTLPWDVSTEGIATSHDSIVWGIRLPRAVLAAVVGATLAVVGAALQGIVRNPLADPAVLGGSSGAAVGAIIVLIAGVTPFGTWSLMVAAFVGSTLGYALTLTLASRTGMLSPVRLILAGVAVSYLLSAVANLLVATADNPNEVRSVVFWQLGSTASAQWRTVVAPAVLLVAGTAVLLLRARVLNALLVGDETAASLGVRPDRVRRQLIVVVALLTAAAVALCGTIAFVGLVVPHAVRLVTGSDHTRVLPLSALCGAVFLAAADIAARLVLEPQELPIGVVTALIGAPVFCVLVRRPLRDL
ncbi:MAG: iron ABC transporter permease [Actinomycetota bacterium]|nr:iron ABC transporter permease [Actinomycetota bacterium]